MTTTLAEWDLRPGDLVLVEFGPTLGTEQDGRRPGLIVSAAAMNQETKRIIVCPVTSNDTPWPTKVFLPDGLAVSGAVLADQMRTIDQKARVLRRLGRAPDAVLAEVHYQILRLLGL